MGFSDRMSAEDRAAQDMVRRKRDAGRDVLRAKAQVIIAQALEGRERAEQAFMAIALLEHAAEAVTALHDAARTQACLGKVASRYGSELKGRSPQSLAERLFRRGS